MVSEEDVRNFLLDRAPEDNPLLDDVQVDDRTVVAGLQFAADLYNTELPIVGTVTRDTFPYRAEAIMLCAAYCLRATAIRLKRNTAETTTQGGTTLDDKRGKPEFYLQLASQLSNEAKERIRDLKVSLNVRQCWAIV